MIIIATNNYYNSIIIIATSNLYLLKYFLSPFSVSTTAALVLFVRPTQMVSILYKCFHFENNSFFVWLILICPMQ